MAPSRNSRRQTSSVSVATATLDAVIRAARRDVLDLFAKSAGQLLDAWFESAALKAAFGFDAIVGNFASPYTPGSAYVLLHHVFGEANGQPGQWGHARGGMGAITQAMARTCAQRGVTLRTDAAVARVIVKARRAVAVELAGGEVVEGRRIVANVNPRLLFEELVPPDDLDPDFLARIRAYKCGSGTFRMNVALSELPDFTALPGGTAQPHHASGIIMAPSLAYMERAYFDAKTTGWSREPIVEVLLPSVVDDSLAPPGMHVASLFCQHVHPDLPSVAPGRTWDDAREEVAESGVEGLTLERVARQIVGPRAVHVAREHDEMFDAGSRGGREDARSRGAIAGSRRWRICSRAIPAACCFRARRMAIHRRRRSSRCRAD